MHRRVMILLGMLLTTAIAATTGAESLSDRAEAALEEARASNQLVGISAAISIDGEIVWSGGAGYADLENQVPARGDMVHRIASISKSNTAVAVMQLVEQEKVDLDRPIQSYVPEFPEKQWPITIRHLLTHTSGIRHYLPGESGTMRHYRRLLDAIAVFQDDPLKFEPGTQFGYSTYGYAALGATVEAVSGESFGDYMRDRVWRPAAMESTRLEVRGEVVPHRARGYSLNPDGSIRNARYTDLSIKYPGGGMLSSAEDLVRFARAVQDGTLVKESTLDRMLEPTRIGDKSADYGLGFNFGRHETLGATFGHSGGQVGTSTLLTVYRDPGIAVAIICNQDGQTGTRPLSDRLAEIAADAVTAASR